MKQIEQTNTDLFSIVTGNNFSGRSRFLKSLSENKEKETDMHLYLGELPTNYISGIFPTVKEEINLHLAKARTETRKKIESLFSIYNFNNHLHKNPFTLSGGEQAILALLCHLALEPSTLSVDTTLEQLNAEWRNPILKAVQQGDFNKTKIFLADNRIDEYGLPVVPYLTRNPIQTVNKEYEWKFNPPVVNSSIKHSVKAENIELKNLSFSYPKGEKILDNINLKLDSGNIYHLSGANGAGKSTFAKILCGILKTDKKHIFVAGKEYNAYRYPGKLTGYSFQNPDEQLFSSTVRSEILLPEKRESDEYRQHREEYIQMFGLQDIENIHPAELPFVMRKRIALASTLAVDRPWYILDEPTLGQDNHFVDFLIELLNDLSQKGKGIIIISHSDTFVRKINRKELSLNNKTITF